MTGFSEQQFKNNIIENFPTFLECDNWSMPEILKKINAFICNDIIADEKNACYRYITNHLESLKSQYENEKIKKKLELLVAYFKWYLEEDDNDSNDGACVTNLSKDLSNMFLCGDEAFNEYNVWRNTLNLEINTGYASNSYLEPDIILQTNQDSPTKSDVSLIDSELSDEEFTDNDEGISVNSSENYHEIRNFLTKAPYIILVYNKKMLENFNLSNLYLDESTCRGKDVLIANYDGAQGYKEITTKIVGPIKEITVKDHVHVMNIYSGDFQRVKVKGELNEKLKLTHIICAERYKKLKEPFLVPDNSKHSDHKVQSPINQKRSEAHCSYKSDKQNSYKQSNSYTLFSYSDDTSVVKECGREIGILAGATISTLLFTALLFTNPPIAVVALTSLAMVAILAGAGACGAYAEGKKSGYRM